MPDVTASRTLVKSAPELWSECSDAESLARHLDGFGEIRITRLEPETAVAWEGEHARGTVTLEPSGWGTRVLLTATPARPVPGTGSAAEQVVAQPDPEPEPAREPEPVPEPRAAEPEPAPRSGFWARLFGRFRREAGPGDEPAPQLDRVSELLASPIEPVSEPEPIPEPPAAVPDPQGALLAALDSLGQAHHRPFSRS